MSISTEDREVCTCDLPRVIAGSSDGKEYACNAGGRVRSLGREDPLEKEKASHTSILAWESPWTEEPGGLQSTGLQRVGHNLATKQQQPANFALANSLWTSQPDHVPHPIPGKTGNPQISWGRLGLRASFIYLPLRSFMWL